MTINEALAVIGHFAKTATRPSNIGIGIFAKSQATFLSKLSKVAKSLGKVSVGFLLGFGLGCFLDLKIEGKSIINHIRDGLYDLYNYLFE